MKTILTITLLFLTTFLSAQNDTIERIVDIKNLEKRDIKNMIPDSNYTTLPKDTTLTGEIIEVCNGYRPHFGGPVLGILKIKSASTDSIFQVIIEEKIEIGFLTKGQQVTIEVAPYDPHDRELNQTTRLTCTTITGFNLSKLKK